MASTESRQSATRQPSETKPVAAGACAATGLTGAVHAAAVGHMLRSSSRCCQLPARHCCAARAMRTLKILVCESYVVDAEHRVDIQVESLDHIRLVRLRNNDRLGCAKDDFGRNVGENDDDPSVCLRAPIETSLCSLPLRRAAAPTKPPVLLRARPSWCVCFFGGVGVWRLGIRRLRHVSARCAYSRRPAPRPSPTTCRCACTRRRPNRSLAPAATAAFAAARFLVRIPGKPL